MRSRFNLGPFRGLSSAALSSWMATALLALAMLLGWTLYTSYRDQERTAEQAISSLTNLLAQDIGRELDSLALSLQAAVEGWRNPETASLSPVLRSMVLFDRSATKQETGSIVITDAAGDIVLDATTASPRKANLSDRRFFQIHRDSPDVGLFVSDPLLSRLSGEWVLSLSRRLENPDGSFGGIVAASIKLSYFRNLFERVPLGQRSTIGLFTADGKVVMRLPFEQSRIGTTIANAGLLRRAQAAPAGLYQETSAFDGDLRIHAFHRISELPLIQSAALSRTEVFASWWSRAAVIISAFIFLSAVVAALTLAFALELRRRSRAERELALLAQTDALTGLGNRRKFDTALHYEWRRAVVGRQTTALLLIDVDFFKAFNDAYGHVAGDSVLVSVAECIARALRAPLDTGARYGGEEFAIIMPNTTTAKAMKIAQSLCRAVEAKAIAHKGSPMGIVTISIGVAAGSTREFLSEQEFVAEADAALYQAKSRGRNQAASSSLHPSRAEEAA